MPLHVAEPFDIYPPADLLQCQPDLKRLAARLARQYVHQEEVREDDLKAVGQALWQGLAVEEAWAAYCQRHAMYVIPLVIVSDEAAIQALPWECLYHPTEGFLGRHPHFTLSRRVPAATKSVPVPVEQGPLRVLLFTSQPDDVDPEQARLNTEDEQAYVLEALMPSIQEGRVVLTVPDDGRFSTFQRLLATHHLVFLSGHGHFEHHPHRDEPPFGVFWFESEQGQSEAIRDRDVAKAFVGSSVQVVVLSACQSGKATSEDLTAGLARQLSHRGLNHVIGMRESILDRAGILFARHFCEAIAQPERVDQALQKGRQAIVQPLQQEATYRDGKSAPARSWGQWCLPMLLTRDPAQPLIDWHFTPTPPDSALLYTNRLEMVSYPKFFIGRRRELRELGQAWAQNRHLLITGAGGQGKTALASRLALRWQERGFLILDYCARPEQTWEAFLYTAIMLLKEGYLNTYQTKEALCTTPERRAKLLLDLLRQQTQGKLIIFFDNLESVQDPHTHEITDPNIQAWLTVIKRLDPHSSPWLLLTSRWQLPHWETAIHHPLTRPNYGDFLCYVQHLHSGHSDRVHLRQLYEALGGNFRGLQFFLNISSQLSGQAKADFLAQLKQAQQDLQTDMAIAKIVEFLTPEERTLLERLPVYASPMIVDGIKVIAKDFPHPEQLLQRLVAWSLVEVSTLPDMQPQHYQCTPLVRAWLQEQGTLIPLAFYERAARYHLYYFEHIHATHSQALATHQALQTAQMTEQAHRFLLDYLVEYFDRSGWYRALVDEWLPPLSQSENLDIKASALNRMGKSYFHLCDYDNALDYLKQSLAIRKEIGDKSGEGTTLNNLSQIFKARGDYDTTLDYLKQSLAIRKEIGDKSGEGTTLNNLSQIYDARGDYDTALDYLKQSLAITKEIGDKSGEGRTLNNFSQIYDARGDYDTALDYLKQSLAIVKELGDKSGEGTTLNNLSLIFRARGDYDTALDYLKQSLAIQQEIGDKSGLCATLFNIGHIHWENEQRQEALSTWVTVYLLAKEIGGAQALEALEKLARQGGQEGLDYWEALAQQFEQDDTD